MSARVEFSEPASRRRSTVLARSQQLVFGRFFEGRHEEKRYYELLQSLAHAHEIHWVRERQAWCRFDRNGDIEAIVTLQETADPGGYGSATSIAIRRDVIEMHMAATKSVLVQMFDSTCIPADFYEFTADTEHVVENAAEGLFYKFKIDPQGASYFRGAQVIGPARTAEEFGEAMLADQNAPRQYASFITLDHKNNRIGEVSCAPDALASYFEKDSPLPLQISPVFFGPQVLDKYKADPEKYKLEHRSISCRNSWHLQTYDINEAGQVHTYIKYLGDLPYSEQLYWKAFNERPKASISRRAFTTDILGSFDVEPDGLRDLQGILQKLDSEKPKWFVLREPELVAQLHYPLTDSSKVWGDTLTALAKCVTEGLEKRFFEKTVKELAGQGDPKWGSIRWAREALVLAGVDEDRIREIVEPLQDVQALRTKLGAHSGGNEAGRIRAGLLKKHQTPRAHIEKLSTQLARSLESMREILGPLTGN